MSAKITKKLDLWSKNKVMRLFQFLCPRWKTFDLSTPSSTHKPFSNPYLVCNFLPSESLKSPQKNVTFLHGKRNWRSYSLNFRVEKSVLILMERKLINHFNPIISPMTLGNVLQVFNKCKKIAKNALKVFKYSIIKF